MYYPKLDEAVAAYLRRTGKTQAQLADEMGMAENTLSWKRRGVTNRGDEREFSLGEAVRLCSIVGVCLSDAVEGVS